MYFFLKYIVTLFYKKLRIKILVCLLRESGPWILNHFFIILVVSIIILWELPLIKLMIKVTIFLIQSFGLKFELKNVQVRPNLQVKTFAWIKKSNLVAYAL